MAIHWQTLTRNPDLPSAYLKAAFNRKVTGERLPELGLRCSLSADPRHLAAYRELCGFGEGGMLPATYPHVLAFALQMHLLTDKHFPFPLLGLVHLRNRIQVLRPLGGVAGVRVSVHAQNLQAHDKGVTFDLVTQVDDPLGPLWQEHSTMLCRQASAEGSSHPVQATPRQPEPALVAVHRWYAAADTGRRYARVSGDYNPIHLSALSARLFGFPTAIAHGMWSLAQTVAALRERLPRSNYQLAVEFHKPVRLPSELILSASAAGLDGQLALHGRDDLLHMSGTWGPVAQ
ncbi:MaoC family dehydratase [Pseudomonas rhizosphaerae]|uniref:MaoC family dehydratase n=1 Tax=Pseudomonas rhizosphaerae TaxID=216142 RepID=UPI002B46946E|nr:MaoC/PaaZ C-terminal domain-containing protein [Pseudomonas rhizosphaerae]MEB2872519.1 MaoC/PaaZ C-terminal domain-containing protein [Pseudomonas rhizosphaerae]